MNELYLILIVSMRLLIKIFSKLNFLLQSNRLIDLVGRVFAIDPRDQGSVPGHVITKTLKMVLDTSLLNT